MKKKDKPNWFFRTLTLLFLIFISLFAALESGYYESKIAKKTAMTEEKKVKNHRETKSFFSDSSSASAVVTKSIPKSLSPSSL